MNAAFTAENARTMALRSWEVRRRVALERAAVEKASRFLPGAQDDEARRQTTLKQIDALDVKINNALDDDDNDLFLALAAAKERLWKLVQPTAGSLRPGRARREPSPDVAPIQPKTPPVG